MGQLEKDGGTFGGDPQGVLTQAHLMELDPFVFSRLFFPERPPQSEGHRGGIPERGVSVPRGIHKQFQILVQTPVCIFVEDGGDHKVRERRDEGPHVHQRPSCKPHLHSDLEEPQRGGCGNVPVWDQCAI